MTNYAGEYQTARLFSYFKTHPGLLISVSYLLLTSCGLMYSWEFYSQFDVAILKLISVSDLLIIGISEPTALLLFLGAAGIATTIDWIAYRSFKLRQKFREKPKSFKRTIILALLYSPRKSEDMALLISSIFALYFFIFISSFAVSKSENIKNGQGDKIAVQSDVLENNQKQVMLLGTTTHFLLTYDADSKKVLALPVENIDKLSSIPQTQATKIVDKTQTE